MQNKLTMTTHNGGYSNEIYLFVTTTPFAVIIVINIFSNYTKYETSTLSVTNSSDYRDANNVTIL